MSDTNTTKSSTTETQDQNTSEAVATTSQSVTSGAQATFEQRAKAYLIDIAAVFVFSLACNFTLGMIHPALGSLVSLLGVAYIIMRDALPFLDGQSLGKKLIGLRAVTTDNASLSGNWQPGIIRNVVLLIPVLPLVEVYMLFTKKDAPEGMLRLGDQWAGTKVITVS